MNTKFSKNFVHYKNTSFFKKQFRKYDFSK